jgi:hypothetical protein
MNSPPIESASDYMARFASAVVSTDDYYILHAEVAEEDCYWFDIVLCEGKQIDFHPCNDHNDIGAIFYFHDLRMPQPIEDVPDLDVVCDPPFCDHKFKEPPGHYTLIVLYADDEGPTKVTAPHNERRLAHVEWRH